MSDATSLPLTPRQREILRQARDHGFATVEALAARLGVSAQTVRREIIRLTQAGLLQRFHGGAGVGNAEGGSDASVRLGYSQKRTVAPQAKDLIGARLAALVPEGSSVFLDVGTTVEAVARALRGHRRLRVFTSSLPAAMLLAGREGLEVAVTGGMVRGADGSLVGSDVTEAVARLRVDFGVIGCSGFDDDGAPMDFDMQKIAAKQAVIARARQAVVVADAGKFARSAVVRIAPPDAFALLVSDAEPPAALATRLAEAGVRVLAG